MIAIIGGLFMASLILFLEPDTPEGVDPSLRNQDVLACTMLQSSLQLVQSGVEADTLLKPGGEYLYPDYFKDSSRDFLTKSSVTMSPRIKAAFLLVSDELLTYPDAKVTYDQASAMFNASLVKLDTALRSACSHVEN